MCVSVCFFSSFFCCLKLFNILSRKIRFLLKCAQLVGFFQLQFCCFFLGVFLFLKASRLSDWFFAAHCFVKFRLLLAENCHSWCLDQVGFVIKIIVILLMKTTALDDTEVVFFKSKIGWDQENKHLQLRMSVEALIACFLIFASRFLNFW